MVWRPLPSLGAAIAPAGRGRGGVWSVRTDFSLLEYVQGSFKYHQYQVVGRHLPTEKDAEPPVFRMKLWAEDPVRAKSKFW